MHRVENDRVVLPEARIPVAAEVDVLFRVIADLKARGVAIVYISHRLEELMRIGDYITVLKDGEHADAKALTSLLALGIVSGSTLVLAARGEGAEVAIRDLAETITRLSAEEIADAERARVAAAKARANAPVWKPAAAPRKSSASRKTSLASSPSGWT